MQFRISGIRGALAQLGERMTGSHEVSGSIPLCSTIFYSRNKAFMFYFILKITIITDFTPVFDYIGKESLIAFTKIDFIFS